MAIMTEKKWPLEFQAQLDSVQREILGYFGDAPQSMSAVAENGFTRGAQMSAAVETGPAEAAMQTILDRLMDPGLIAPDPGTYYSGLRGGLTYSLQSIIAAIEQAKDPAAK